MINGSPTDIFLNMPGLRSHLVDWGGPALAPTILLIHGTASNAKMWNLVGPRLAQTFRVLALDQRSHGLTESPIDNDFSFAAVCGDMHRIVGQLGIVRPIVVGHSWGGNVALEYAARYVESVAGIVMIEGGFVGLNKVMTWSEFETTAAPTRWSGKQLVELLEQVKRVWGEHYSEAVLDEVMGNFEIRADQTIEPRLSFDNQIQIMRATWEQHAKTLYKQVKSPALFVPCLPPQPCDQQTEQVMIWKREMVIPFIRAMMPHSQVDWLVDSIHDVPLQRPELVEDKIRAFVQTIAF